MPRCVEGGGKARCGDHAISTCRTNNANHPLSPYRSQVPSEWAVLPDTPTSDIRLNIEFDLIVNILMNACRLQGSLTGHVAVMQNFVHQKYSGMLLYAGNGSCLHG